ncbi:type II toxin-antitoxin system death-on-curing family toxin [Ornithinimicrobium sp. Y1694]|uniref:type II toxin-antitoxin system death-on-curing family toxin n=1 Tax=Ornithinimicrobium sp. Y1694 TaxID=3418590 RepID=UPI003CF53C86
MEYLTTEDLLALAADLGVGPVQDLGLLDSAAHRPGASVLGRDAYPDIDTQAGALLESIVVNHPLVDGNKRLGWLAVVVFYGLNGIDLQAPDDAAYDLVIAVASGKADHQAAGRQLVRWRSPVSLTPS